MLRALRAARPRGGVLGVRAQPDESAFCGSGESGCYLGSFERRLNRASRSFQEGAVLSEA
jgi:hypothetical protein